MINRISKVLSKDDTEDFVMETIQREHLKDMREQETYDLVESHLES